MTAPERLTLAQAAAEWGTTVPCAGNLPVDIGEPEFAWFIESGAVDLFLVERQGEVEQSAPQHMLRARAGRLLPGTAPQEDITSLGVIAKGLPGTTLRRLPVSRLSAIRSAELAEQVDAWLVDISAMLVRDVTHSPRTDALLATGEAPTTRNGTLAVRRGVIWLTGLQPHAGLFMGLIDPAQSETGASGCALPLTPATWFSLTREVRVATASSAELAELELLLPAVKAFNRVAFSLERLNRQLAVVDQANLARARVLGRRSDEEDARRRLFDLYGALDGEEGAEEQDVSALYDALRAIGRHEGITFRGPASTGGSDPETALAKVLRASGVRARQVRLSGKDRWWVGDSGAMLAFRAADGRPLALLPGLLGNYREIDPASGRKRRITATRAASLRPNAWLFYAPLQGEASRWRDLLRLAGKGLGADSARIVLTGVLGGLVALLPAVAIGFVADEVIPVNDVGLLYGISVGLVAFGLVRALMRVLQGMTVMRFESRATSRLESAFWDRLLRLPTRVLRRYPANDLAMRGMTFQSARGAAQSVIGNGVLSIVFLSPAFLLIGLRDPTLGWLTAAFGVASMVATVALGLQQIAPYRRRLRAAGRLAGRLFQLVNGISKLRVDGAEGSGFAVWARDYREQKRAELEVGAVEMHLRALGAALPLLAAALLVLVLALSGPETIAVGDFIVVYVLFLLYQTAVVRLGESVTVLAGIVPAFDQIRPLLAETPETGAEGQSVEVLGGDVAFDHVSFRYDADGPLILDDVSIQVRAGEFVAIAGESGAGKSTLFRLALGLERPSSGSVYYDDRDLQHLDLREVRRHIGVVPQMVRLHPQDLWDNIVGDHQGVTPEDAWRAIQLAAIDREISAMPMGMLTPVGASAAVTSGGESQRIRLAHALISDPRILLLDEATNWLDNETQSRVLANLSSLTSTRIVIAHRVSTLRHADRIYVMQAGRIVQEGTFEEMAATPGVFQDLVRRQVA
ncbi:MAG: ATP-binding cassette domain-containing protein [Gemmatimonadetes bacterium]|nr:ATP-binding cassette domain-containing protein [Gemmatimonadota bacterium]MCY3678150.1 ATP-binding cassette domain-containing protein [Gemmatimonadota bacterium]